MDIQNPDAECVEIENTEQPEEKTGFLHMLTAQTPWWAVSVTLHVLIIVLTTLISYNIDLDSPPPLVMATITIESVPVQPVSTQMPVEQPVHALGKTTIPGPDDLTAPSVVIDPALLTAESVAEKFTTFNPDMEDRGGALGHPDADVIFTAKGTLDEVPGGSGSNGSAELSDMLIGLSGAGSRGSGNGMFNGDGHGIGNGKGDGKAQFGGRFGSNRLRIGRKSGMTKGDGLATDSALVWLAYHQQPDGSWDSKKYGASSKSDTACTGFALLAFLGAGHTERVGPHKDAVKKAVAWLKSKQAADGAIWDTTDDGATHRKIGYPNAIATLAMAEAAAMANVKDTRESAQKAIDYCTKIHQQGQGSDKRGWRYSAGSEGDLSVTGWYIMALKSAKVAGLQVDHAAFDGAIAFLDSMEVKETEERNGYGASRFKYMAGADHAQSSHRLTAIGTLARLFLGVPRDQVQGSVEAFVRKGGVPEHGANGEKVDLYYWYYGAMCTFQQGPDSAVWKTWSTAMRQELVGTQCKAGDDAGSWNPAGEYSAEWGRVGQTALSALCMEVYYRYDLLGK